MTIQFLMDAWEDAENDAPEICKTAGSLRIVVGPRSLTRNEDRWSQTVKQTVRVAAYPLAQWLAASWWRLMYEPLPIGDKAPTSWRMAHEVSAAGCGFLWPRIVLASDGENLQVWSAPTREGSEQPVRYLTDWHGTAPVQGFADAVDDFMGLVLDRLDAVGLGSTDLAGLWREILEERKDPELSAFRRMEATLGFEPDEFDAAIVERFVGLRESIGSSAPEEIASACSSGDPLVQLERVQRVAEMEGMPGRLSLPKIEEPAVDHRGQPPWARGQALAQSLRDTLGLNGHAIRDPELSDLVGLSPKAFHESAGADRLPLGVAIRGAGDTVKFVLRKRNPAGRRFEFARLICDHLLFGACDTWLPATDTKTIRQKWQRAFAAEFLCPIDALVTRLGDDLSDDSVEDAADHFGVSEMTVASQLVNHGVLTASALDEKPGESGFPYVI